ncbi:hypothetical protein D3H55_15415 [Bacillus salacetis]|uniref:Uncharacterized protein n=1 Tax=Bacillus salacetis TaxID=2315464 RepID=A0A3A1QYS9_9BACI|nr:hypothetical protein [Bacillus salacetis]RIW31359.1 hypothetical protein D3H55_15415 [Bacillus salacetis]
MILRATLLALVLFGFFTGFLNAGSTTESVIWLILGIAGLLGVLTWGRSSKDLSTMIRDTFS